MTEYDGSIPIKYPKQEQFCNEYIIDLNGAASARRAGYSENTSNTIAAQLLAKISVQKRIEYLKTQSVKRIANKNEMIIDADRVLEEMARLAFSNINDFISISDDGYAYIDLSRATPAQLASVSAIEVIDMPPVTMIGSDGETMTRQVLKVKLKMWDKVKALENLMKHLGLLKEKVEIEGLDRMIQNLQKGRARVAAHREED